MRFRGGYRFSQFEGEATPALTTMPPAGTVSFDLADPLLEGYSPAVTQGYTVRTGEPLLASDDGNWVLPASINGTVKISGTVLSIETDHTDTIIPIAGHPREPWHLPHGELIALIRETGTNLLLGKGITYTPWYDTVTTVIVNTVHTSPLTVGWSPALYGDTSKLAAGIRILGSLFTQARIVLTTTPRHKNSLSTSQITEYAKVTVLSDKYPQEHPSLLARDSAGKEVTDSSDPAVLVLDDTRVVQLAEILTGERPCIDRIVCIAGPGVSRPGWYRIRIGTSLASVQTTLGKKSAADPWRTILGNPLSGSGIEDMNMPVWYDTDEISVISEHAVRDLFQFLSPGLAHDSYARATVSSVLPLFKRRIETNLHGGVRPCVQCNYCDEVCPAGIYPFLIWKYVQAEKTEESFRFRPDTCIECGLCDYVCPSKIDIKAGVESAKQALLTTRRDHAAD